MLQSMDFHFARTKCRKKKNVHLFNPVRMRDLRKTQEYVIKYTKNIVHRDYMQSAIGSKIIEISSNKSYNNYI